MLDLLMLYISKSGAIVVGVFVLPWYQQLLGPAAFGVVALVLSLQAFLLMLDLGTSTLVGRDLASEKSKYPAITTLLAAQLVLHIAYLILLVAIIVTGALWVSAISVPELVACVVFFWVLTVQNVGQSAMLARRQYILAGATQAIGVLARAVITLAALEQVSADLYTFLLAQSGTAIVQMIFTAWFCSRILKTELVLIDVRSLLSVAREISKRGRPLIVFGLAGAAVLQMDKVIVSSFLSPSALAPYFLASVLCVTPISVLAGPVAQFFQPRIINSISNGRDKDAEHQLRLLTAAIVCAVVIPSALLWLGRDFVTNAWLHGQPNVAAVAHYVSILLPGVALGALGYIPYTVLIAHQDYRVQAKLSAVMTVVTLLATAVCAALGSVEGVCWVYAAYHSLSTLVSWLRSIQLQPHTPEHQYATRTAKFAMAMLLQLTAVCGLLANSLSLF